MSIKARSIHSEGASQMHTRNCQQDAASAQPNSLYESAVGSTQDASSNTDNEEITVSVVCLTHNHQRYISSAIESFISQKTSFRYEVIIHDDASTDGTAEIVRAYAKQHPGLIKAVFQSENQYSKGIQIAPTFLYPLIRGRYVAICEGDDRWTSPDKLERQVSALEKHPEIDICTHRTVVRQNGRFKGYIAPRNKDRIIEAKDVIIGGGNFVATSSILCRTDVYKLLTPMREVLYSDYVLQIQASLRGGMYYLNECMSQYNYKTEGSWTEGYKGLRKIAVREANKKMLNALDSFTEGRFSPAIALRKDLYDSDSLLTKHRYLGILAPRFAKANLYRLLKKTGLLRRF